MVEIDASNKKNSKFNEITFLLKSHNRGETNIYKRRLVSKRKLTDL